MSAAPDSPSPIYPILSRRSIRRFAVGSIADDAVHDLLKAAMAAPSAAGRDPWHFVVVRVPGLLVRLAEALPRGSHVGHAAIAIVVCGDVERAHRHTLGYLVQDCSAATQNILLAATAMGLGSCWLGIHPNPEREAAVRQVLTLPKTIVPVSAVAIGIPDEFPRPRTRYRDAAVHYDGW